MLSLEAQLSSCPEAMCCAYLRTFIASRTDLFVQTGIGSLRSRARDQTNPGGLSVCCQLADHLYAFRRDDWFSSAPRGRMINFARRVRRKSSAFSFNAEWQTRGLP